MKHYITDYPARYKQRKAKGLCINCGDVAMEGSHWCDYHHNYHTEYARKKQAEKRAERALKTRRFS